MFAPLSHDKKEFPAFRANWSMTAAGDRRLRDVVGSLQATTTLAKCRLRLQPVRDCSRRCRSHGSGAPNGEEDDLSTAMGFGFEPARRFLRRSARPLALRLR